MPKFQSYMVVYEPKSGSVLVAFKKIYGYRFQGREGNGSYLNYGGQLVFPGGIEKAASAEAAALEEFRQETGVNARNYINENTLRTVSFTGGFYATFAEVDPDYAQALVTDSNINIYQGTTQDEELQQVGFISYGDALQHLPEWDRSGTTIEAMEVLQLRSKYAFDKSWFLAIMQELLRMLQGARQV